MADMTFRDKVANVLAKLDELAEVWGDEGVFRRCRDGLREAIQQSDDEYEYAIGSVIGDPAEAGAWMAEVDAKAPSAEAREVTCDWRTPHSYCLREGVHVFGNKAYCDSHAVAAGEKPRAIALITNAIHDAGRDISEWKQLGRRWMSESPDYTRDPKCPTDAGMQRSDDVLKSLATALKAIRNLTRDFAVSEEPPCSTPSPSTVVPPDQATWDILCAYLADEDHHGGSGISEGRLTEILDHRLGWGRLETRAAWFDAVARGNALIEEDHRRKAPLIQAEIERMTARDTSSKAKNTEAPPPSSSETGSAGG